MYIVGMGQKKIDSQNYRNFFIYDFKIVFPSY